MELNKFVGSKIKQFREERGMNQEDLAFRLSTTRQTVSRYENGDRKANQDVLFELASIFDKKIDDFFPQPENSFSDQEETDIQKEVERLMSDIKNGNYILEGEELSEDAKESLRGAFENAVRTAKLINRNTK